MHIRPATLADAPALTTLAADTFTETFAHLYDQQDLADFLASTYTDEQHRELISSPEHFLHVLVDAGAGADESGGLPEGGGGPLVGYVLAGPSGLPGTESADGEVKRLYVRSTRQRGGHGRRLLEGAIDWLLRDGPRDLYLGVWSENVDAQRLYRRYGFEKWGEYEFAVGAARDREFIFRRPADAE